VDTITKAGCDYHHFTYEAQQGHFAITLPAADGYLIDTDRTAELIVSHIATCLKQQYLEGSFKVKALEGIGKGATSTT
jgi:hypothetical protein